MTQAIQFFSTPNGLNLALSASGLVTALYKAHQNKRRIERVGRVVNSLANGGGDAKIDNRLKSYGVIRPDQAPSPPTNLPGSPANLNANDTE